MDELKSVSNRERNKNFINQNSACQSIIKNLKEIEEFWDDFSFLSVGRTFMICRKHLFSLQMVLESLEFTVGSIISCCEFGCLADANTLLRKYRDDIFFCLYIIAYDTYKFEVAASDKIAGMENIIEKWLNNSLGNLYIGDVLKTVASFPEMQSAIKKYNLKSFFDSISDRLNNYVHSNGITYYNRSVDDYRINEFSKELKKLLDDMRFITVSFLFLITLCSPITIMSTDYVDCLDLNIDPPYESEYWVASFVEKFFRDNLKLIDKNCIDYLRENTPMQFNEWN